MKKITIGRDETSTIVIKSSYQTVSKNHAEIVLFNGELLFTDHSSNGTLINGQKLHGGSRKIKEGDNIMLAGIYKINWSELQCYLSATSGALTTVKWSEPAPEPINTKNVVNNFNKEMDSSQANAFLMAHSQELPQDQIVWIRERLNHLDDNKFSALCMLQFKNPTTALILSLFLGNLGVDRFYIGNTGLGIFKLLTCGGLGIWAFIDWFLIMGATRKQNFKNLSMHLGML